MSKGPSSFPGGASPLGGAVRHHGSRGFIGGLLHLPLLSITMVLLGVLGIATMVLNSAPDGLAVGAGMVGVSVALLLLLWLVYGRSRDTITIHEGGFHWVHRGDERVVPWTALVGLEVSLVDIPRRRLPGTNRLLKNR
jgi:hypothetical protein